MLKQSKSNNSNLKSHSKDHLSNIQQRPEEMSSMQESTVNSKPFGLSQQNVAQMQRTVGNKAVQRMFSNPSHADKPTIQRNPNDRRNREARGMIAAPAAVAPAMQVPVAAPVPVAGAPLAAGLAGSAAAAPIAAPIAAPGPDGPVAAPAPAPARPAPTKDLSKYPNYNDVYKWLKARAGQEKKAGLFAYFDDLTTGGKMSAIKVMCGNERSPDIDKLKNTMLTGVFTKTLDWDRFSEISREAKDKNIRNYNEDQARDYAAYTALGTSGAAGGVSGTAALSNSMGAGGALAVTNSVAPAAGVLSGVASISQIYNASENYDSSLSTVEKTQLVGGEASGGVADLTRFTAGTVNSVRTLGGMAASGAATVAAGAAGVVGGAAYLAGGVAGYIESGKNAKNLGKLENKFNVSAETDKHQRDLGLAANLGGSTQVMNKSKSATTAAKGALMIAGGAVMLAAAVSPIGPILLAAAAIIGGIGALIKFYRKTKRTETFVDKALNIDKEVVKPENSGLKRAEVRQKILETHGFNNIDQCYTQIVTDLASMLYESGVAGTDEESKSVIENLGLKVDKDKKKPGKDLIAKKLHT